MLEQCLLKRNRKNNCKANMSIDSKKHHQTEFITLYEVSKILSSSLDINKNLNQSLEIMASNLEMQRGMISLIDDTKTLKTIASIGLTKQEEQRGNFRIGEGITGKIFQYGMPMVVPNIANEPLFLNKTGAYQHIKKQAAAFLGVPIKVNNECIGVLSFQINHIESFAGFQPTLRLLNMVARLIGQAVWLSKQVTARKIEPANEILTSRKHSLNKSPIKGIIGRSEVMQKVLSDVCLAAQGHSTILLRGESGTGKEMIAQAIHHLSSRKDAPFIKTNCAALNESLLESELFGHEKGAYTGALHQRIGRFEQANGGTLFLDEIGDISAAFQLKLLRVLQEREFERVGGNSTIKVNVRLICATNRNLEEDVRQGKFRADLYFRINVVSIHLPALRERKDDIPLLVQHILRKYNMQHNTKIDITQEAMEVLCSCHWPGNIRELENCVARFCTLSQGSLIHNHDIPCQNDLCLSRGLWDEQKRKRKHIEIPILSVPDSVTENEIYNSAFTHSDERSRIIDAMEKCGWVQAKAARLLKLTPRQIGYALKKHHISLKKL